MKIKRLLRSIKTFRRKLKKLSPKIGVEILLAPPLLWVVGAGMNAIVMGVNNGQMPVLWPGGCERMPVDGLHVCMTAQTHLRVIADWIVMHNGVASPGDMILYLSDMIWYPTIAAWALLMNERLRNAR